MPVRFAPALLATLAVAACAPTVDPAARAMADQRALAEIIGTRMPGPVQNCIASAPGLKFDAVGDKIVAQWGGRTWVSTVDGNCRAASGGGAYLVTEPDPTNQYCANTPMRVVSNSGGMMLGSCVLGPWVPYN